MGVVSGIRLKPILLRFLNLWTIPAEGCSLRLQQRGHWGQKITFSETRTDGIKGIIFYESSQWDTVKAHTFAFFNLWTIPLGIMGYEL